MSNYLVVLPPLHLNSSHRLMGFRISIMDGEVKMTTCTAGKHCVSTFKTGVFTYKASFWNSNLIFFYKADLELFHGLLWFCSFLELEKLLYI